MSLAEAFSSMVLEVFSTTSITCFATESTEASSTPLYSQLDSLSLLTAALTLSTSTKLRHTTLPLVGLLLTIMYSSGLARDPSTSSKVSRVLLRGSGKKNALPLQAFKEL